jgi:transposase
LRYNAKTEVSEMEKVPRGLYTKEFKEEAVKLVTEAGLSIPETARRLSVGKSTIEYWIRKARNGTLSGQGRATDAEMEINRLRRENAELRMERDILKKAAAYFAKESLRGTRS